MLSYLATGAHASVTMTRLGEDYWGIVIGPSHGLHSVRAATVPDHPVPSVAGAVHRTTCQAGVLLARVTTVMGARVNWANSPQLLSPRSKSSSAAAGTAARRSGRRASPSHAPGPRSHPRAGGAGAHTTTGKRSTRGRKPGSW